MEREDMSECDDRIYREGMSNVGFAISATRTSKTTPDGYRLACKSNGELILQGAYFWQHGRDSGYEWRDIPTVNFTE